MYTAEIFIFASGLFVFLRAQWWVVVVSIENNGHHEAIGFDFRLPYLNSGNPLTCVRSYRQRWFTPVITQQARNALNEGATTYYYANEACNTNSYCRYRVLYYWQCSHHLYNYVMYCNLLHMSHSEHMILMTLYSFLMSLHRLCGLQCMKSLRS